MPIDFRRGATSKKMLEVTWAYPVWRPVTEDRPKDGDTTTAVMAERALPLEQAYAYITKGDRRPLLILRECERCKGTDHALLSRSLDNEQTVLLTHWFHCVKLPPNVLNENHPFFNLFKREKDGDRIPHLFFCDPDGGNKAALPGDQPQAELWATMFAYLDRCYDDSAKESLRELRKLLSQYDKVDGLEQEVKTRIDKEIEKNGPKSPKLKKLEADLAKLGRERDGLKAREAELRDLSLKAMLAAPKDLELGAKKEAGEAAGQEAGK